ncbi:aminopeptidase P N-terminal domain-containing protein [Piscinibacter sakaiensis]|uniref:aminopeptidase P N-terminal domain-containing protein n=1 Tax=Piscinibacter sakaiensis TaxID=1547922 RepID=UPI003AB02F71
MSITPPSLHCADRRAALAAAMQAAGGGIALIPTAPQRQRNGDSEHPYRHDSHFHHLTGFNEPEAWLVLSSDGVSTIFLREKDIEREIWDGLRLGVDAAKQTLGVDRALPIGELDRTLPDLLDGQPAVWWPFGVHEGIENRVEHWLGVLRGRARLGVEVPTTLRDLGPLLAEMRLHKDGVELELMRRAATISAGAHRRAMAFCAARFRAGASAVHEYEIEAELLHEFRRHGASGPAYTPIVAAGANACVLHYAAGDAACGDALLTPGELCLIDAGCEFAGYASDITRTFPGGGRFSGPQRELYLLVLAAHDAAVAETRPGARQRDAHHAAVRVLAQGMLDLGLLDRNRDGDLDAVIDSAAYRRFYMHGTGHWLGRDVHDVGEYLSLDEAPFEQSDGIGGRCVRKPSRRLAPGMVVTIEPGIYVRPAEGIDEKWWHIGIRIEDDAVITAGGCELITRGVPVAPDEIEALMRDS